MLDLILVQNALDWTSSLLVATMDNPNWLMEVINMGRMRLSHAVVLATPINCCRRLCVNASKSKGKPWKELLTVDAGSVDVAGEVG